MQNVVVDTNILVRALINPDGSDGKILRMAFDETVQLWYSKGLLLEFIRVLSYPRLKKYLGSNNRSDVFLESLITFGKIITPQVVHLCRDPDDNEIIGVAMAVAANHPVALVSADKDILVLTGSIDGVAIMTPQEFLEIYRRG